MSLHVAAVVPILTILTFGQTLLVHPPVLNHPLGRQWRNQQIVNGLMLIGLLLVRVLAGETWFFATKVRA
jgi:hypothetical protein